MNKSQNRLTKFMDMLITNKEEEGSIDISFAGLFRCMLCTHPKSKAEQVQLLQISEQILELDSKLKQLELYVYIENNIVLDKYFLPNYISLYYFTENFLAN